MNIEKIGFSLECRPRKMDFIKYSNKSYTSNPTKKAEECFTESVERENALVSLNFLA